MSDLHEIVLKGCTATPLSSYLKGLGILRLLARIDPSVRGSWREHMVLHSRLTEQEVLTHLLDEYAPTPILAPWNGGSGFYEKDNKTALLAIAKGGAKRLEQTRFSLQVAEQSLTGVDRKASPKDQDKNRLLARLRGTLPDHALDWFDAAILLAGDSAQFPPLLGTGGNDGRLDFTNNFMQRLLDLFDPDSGAATALSRPWLRMALLGEPAPSLLKKAIGQFAPGQVGGPNSTTGFDAKGGVNPWDFVLMIEGALPFAAAAVRRNEQQNGDGVLSYPFTVRATAAGAGNLGLDDAGSSRGELWMPLWSQPASYPEVRALLAEGRVALGKRPAKDALDFVRAVHRLAGYRGVDRFQRYGLLMRSGKAYLATPLEQVRVTANPGNQWLDELDRGEWLSGFRRFSQSDLAARRFATLRKRLEDSLFDLARRPPSPARVQALLLVLAEIQLALANSKKAREAVKPLPLLSEQWVAEADDKSSVYRIARAVAGLHGFDNKPLPLRAQLFPIHPRFGGWIESACSSHAGHQDPNCRLRLCQDLPARLTDRLIQLLGRRLQLADRLELPDKPMLSAAGVDLDDINAFLHDPRMDPAIAALISGLALCRVPRQTQQQKGEGEASAAFALMKAVLTPDRTLRQLTSLSADKTVPVPVTLLPKLAAGAADVAVKLAWQRLRNSGLSPAMDRNVLPRLAGVDHRRMAAALCIPLTYGASAAITRAVLDPTDDQPSNHRDTETSS